jgi:hypothetical protein
MNSSLVSDCGGSQDTRGNKLCCGQNSQFDPPTFECVPNTFGAIDKDKDGRISHSEWNWAFGILSSSSLNLANAQARSSTEPALEEPDFNPIIFIYVMGTAAMFCGGAIYLLYLVYKGFTRKPPPNAPVDGGEKVESPPQ